MDKPWLDFVSCALPRCRTKRCLGSFFKCFQDRGDYRMRLIFHLDKWRADLKRWGEDEATQDQASWDMAVEVSKWFDDAVMLRSDRNIGYGGSLLATMSRVENRVLYCEDDKLWSHPLSVGKAVSMSDDGGRFIYWLGGVSSWKWINRSKPPLSAGSTGPGVWPVNAPRWLLDHFPPIPEHMSEAAMVGLMGHVGMFTSDMYDWDNKYWRDIGNFRGKSPAAKKYLDRNTGQVVRVRGYEQALKACGVTNFKENDLCLKR